MKSIALLREAEEPDTLAIVNVTSDLAVLLRKHQRPDEAEPLYREVLATRQQYLGEPHPLVAQSFNNLAVFLRNERGAMAEAESLSYLAADMYRETLGPDHTEYAIGLNTLGHSLIEADKCEEAVPVFMEAADVYERAVPNHWAGPALPVQRQPLPDRPGPPRRGRAAPACAPTRTCARPSATSPATRSEPARAWRRSTTSRARPSASPRWTDKIGTEATGWMGERQPTALREPLMPRFQALGHEMREA